MRIAFTSCFSADLFPDQPVWKEIANAQPDVLVLLGDSIYALAGTPFPATLPAFDRSTPPPGYQHVDLGLDVHLHLTDGRTWRAGNDSALLGAGQLDAIEQQTSCSLATCTTTGCARIA